MFQIRFIPLLLVLLTPLLINCASTRSETRFNLSVIHVNDFHARFEESSESGGMCKKGEKCIGGFSRLYKQIKDILETKPDSILLNAGDNFQGTLWYTLGKWNVTQEFLNKLPFDATVLGNHEFDDNIEGLIPFMKSLKSPIVVSNIDDSLEPTFQGLYNKSTVIERNGKKIGIIGAILSIMKYSGSVGNLDFYLESPSVNAEAERLVREEGVFTNIVLTHAGYDIDQLIAANASEKISLIVGGHTHTFLYTGENPPGPEKVGGPYPTIVKSKNGKNILVVQAASFCRYLGNITIFLDDFGEFVDYSGEPIFLDNTLPQDVQINKDLLPWKKIVDAKGGNILGSSLVTLDMSKCKYSECNFGNLVADAMVYSWTDKAEKGSWTYASIAVVSSGSIRTNIAIGNITYNDLITAVPYNNTYDVVEIEGKYIKQLLEYNTLPYFDSNPNDMTLKLMQFSGIHVVLDLTLPEGNRVQSLKLRCQACEIPIYEDLDLNKTYRIVVNSFIANGGDNYTMLSDNIKSLKVGRITTDVLTEYIGHRSPIFQEEEGRIVIFR